MPEVTLEQALATGLELVQANKLQDAELVYRQILANVPQHPEPQHFLGVIAYRRGQYSQAAELIRKAISIYPSAAVYHANLAVVLLASGQLDEGIAELRQTIALQTDNADAYHNLGMALLRKGQNEEAIEAARKATELRPDRVENFVNLGVALRRAWRLDESLAALRQAVKLNPNHPGALNNLGNVLATVGEREEAMKCYDQALAARPEPATGSNRLYTLLFDPEQDARSILQECRAWNDRFARSHATTTPMYGNDRSANRKLRIGYVSPDFGRHVVGQQLLPLLREHDRDQFEIYCYSSLNSPDEMTAMIRSSVKEWRDISSVNDTSAAGLIRDDRIDVLVDLSAHTSNNRLMVFARKPAPVQMTYLGYCGTTGVDAIDYRISDPYFDPADGDLSAYSERTMRLPKTYWCYEAAAGMPEVGELPARAAGHVTFGSLNQFRKATPEAQALWAKILKTVPGSRLLMHSPGGEHEAAVRDRFAAAGVEGDRIEFVQMLPLTQYEQAYNRIDIGLDPFPYGGGITTCDSLWMGVPVVTLRGKTSVGRGGCSILSNVGLPELIAETPEEYVKIAARLAGDLSKLAEMRRGLRGRMDASPLRDAKQFARDVESIYRQVWQRWCQQ